MTIHDAVIVGSGFGGSIAALRLAEAGRSVLVLERGRRWLPGSFPRSLEQVDELLWRYPRAPHSQGLFELRRFSALFSVTASGVGGGSLVYASIHYRPKASVFDDPRWPEGLDLESLEPYYRRVEYELDVETVPPALELAKRDAFHRAAEKLGRNSWDTPQAVSWNRVRDGGAGRNPCKLCAECEFGCNHGAKNTLDFNYLARAEAAGAIVETGCQVSHLSPGSSPHAPGGWDVHYRDTGTGEPRRVTGRRVVVAAGTLGSNEILLRSRDLFGTLPRLSSRLGHGYSANGDFLGNIQNASEELEGWVGPDVTSVMSFDDQPPELVLATPTFSRPVMEVLASLGQARPGPLLRRAARPLYRWLDVVLPLLMRRGLLSQPLRRAAPGAGPAGRFTTVFAIGRDNANGRLFLRRGKLDLAWSYERENRALIERQLRAMADLSREYGGSYANLATWELFGRIMTVHNLGGCALSTSIDTGVVGTDGQVHGHPGLFVADGSVIPTSIGSHPAMTISALAERIAERVVASFR